MISAPKMRLPVRRMSCELLKISNSIKEEIIDRKGFHPGTAAKGKRRHYTQKFRHKYPLHVSINKFTIISEILTTHLEAERLSWIANAQPRYSIHFVLVIIHFVLLIKQLLDPMRCLSRPCKTMGSCLNSQVFSSYLPEMAMPSVPG